MFIWCDDINRVHGKQSQAVDRNELFECLGHLHECLAYWHIKNGGTRDPRRCLRIYYFWDATTQQVVIADMPAHRVTEAT